MKAILLSCFVLITVSCSAQNLVPNPSFEEGNCPTGMSQLDSATGWITIRSTPDYFNRCAVDNPMNGYCGIPENDFGYQYPPISSCSAFCGLATYNPFTPNCSEILGCELMAPLNIGQRYYVSFKTVLCSLELGASNNIGALFKTTQNIEALNSPNANRAQIKSDVIITDTVNWTTLFGSFVADSAYKYLELGNFFDDSLTQLISQFNAPYYFLDDVCVSTDSSFCANYIYHCGASSITAPPEKDVMIYPNPAQDKLHFSSGGVKGQLFTVTGLPVLNFDSGYSTELDVSGIADGVYLLMYEYEGRRYVSKQVIMH